MGVSYKLFSYFFDFFLGLYFTERGINPRNAILNRIPDTDVKILDMCCGTMTEGIMIAKKRKNAQIIGIDRSENMLRIAKEKIDNEHITNTKVKCCDATNTGLKSEQFDYITISLVLHEISTELAQKMLAEAHRLLKPNGKLIVLEWEKSNQLSKRLKFLPIKLLEPKPFKTFFTLDKDKYFSENSFKVIKQIHCDYTCAYEMIKI